MSKVIGAFALFFSFVLMGCCPNRAVAQGTVTVPLSNVTPTCINAAKETIDFFLLSARVPKNQNWFTDVNGVGARVDVQMSGSGTQVNFPAAAAINTKDINGKIIRASLRLHVLANQDLWDPTNTAAAIRTTNLNTPVTFTRREGTSDTAKLMQTLISFTNTVGAAIPPNPYVQGAEMVGKLANSMLTVFQPDPNEVVDPNFSLSFSIGRSDSNCQPTDIQAGVGAEIADSNLGGEDAGIIQTAHLSDYCFYKLGSDADPDVGFSKRAGAATCASTVPDSVQTLNNPQFIWFAFGTCKDGQSCPNSHALALHLANPLNALQDLASLSRTNNVFAGNLLDRVGKTGVDKILKLQVSASRKADLRALSVVGAVSLCKSVGISSDNCLSRNFKE